MRMRIRFSLLVLSLVFSSLIGVIPSVHSSVNPADYHWSFWVGGLRIWVQYPEECHAGDSISYNILIYSSRYGEGNYVDEMKVIISVPVSPTETTWLFDAWIYKDMSMSHGYESNKTITVAVPEEAWWYVTIVFDVSTYSGDMTEHASSNLGLTATKVRHKTYSELQSENYDLWYNYTNLKVEYDNYKGTHEHSDYEYNSLNSTYNQYAQTHAHSNSEYDDLQSSYDNVDRELGIVKNLHYIMTVTTIVFIATTVCFIITTVYFVRKAKAKALD